MSKKQQIFGRNLVKRTKFARIFFIGSLHQHTSDKNWRNRRSQKLDKMELLNLQSSLQSEIQAKAAISEELSRTRADLIAAQK